MKVSEKFGKKLNSKLFTSYKTATDSKFHSSIVNELSTKVDVVIGFRDFKESNSKARERNQPSVDPR